MYGGFGLVPGARNAWSYWIDHILKQRERFGFLAATMVTTRGATSAFTNDFLPTPAEVQVKMTVMKFLLTGALFVYLFVFYASVCCTRYNVRQSTAALPAVC